MKQIMDFAVYLFGVLAVAYGCSEPEGGFKTPTPAETVSYAKHVVVGKVTELIRPDPIFQDIYGNETYGAKVTVQCTYKGGPLSGRIQIGAAGFIPGHCTSKDLEAGKEYVLFLGGKRQNENSYEQSAMAVLKSQLIDYLNVCGLNMQYPEENGITLKRKVCPPESKLDTCQRHGDSQQSGMVEKATVKVKPDEMQGQKTTEKVQPAVGKEGADDTNTAMAVVTSLFAILVCVIVQLL